MSVTRDSHRPPTDVDKQLSVGERDTAGVRVLTVEGGLDLDSAPRLCGRLDAAVRSGRRYLVVDLVGAAYCDTAAVRALVGTAREVTACAGQLAVVAPVRGPIARLLTVTGAREALSLYAGVDAALHALIASRPLAPVSPT